MQAIVQVVLNLLSQLLPQLGGANAALIAKIIDALIVIVPIISKQFKDMLPPLKRIIIALKDSGKLTEDQWNQLIEFEVQIDAEFDSAASAALADDEAADKQQQ